MNWKSLTDESQLVTIVEKSTIKPQIIFKHSVTCPISSMAKRRLDASEDQLDFADVYYLDLLQYRSISNSVSEKFEVHHESPQVIIINHGEATYDESHLDINVEDILEHVKFLAQ